MFQVSNSNRILIASDPDQNRVNPLICIKTSKTSFEIPRKFRIQEKYPRIISFSKEQLASVSMCESEPAFSQMRIQDLVKGVPASEAESCRHSKVESRERSEQSVAGVQGPLKGPGSFWVFNAQICILTHSRDSFSLIFDIYFDTKC